MSGKNINLNDIEIKKSDFYKNKKIKQMTLMLIISQFLKKNHTAQKKSFKYFTGYNNDIIRPLCITLSQISGYVRKFNENSTMPFRVKDKQLLKNYSKIWEKIEKLDRF